MRRYGKNIKPNSRIPDLLYKIIIIDGKAKTSFNLISHQLGTDELYLHV